MAWLKKKRPITVHMRKYNAYLRRPRVTVFPIRAVAYLMRWNWPSDEAIFGSLLTLESARQRCIRKQSLSLFIIWLRKSPSIRLRTEGLGLSTERFRRNLGVCAVFVGPLLENLKTDTTFLLRSPKT